MLCFHEQAAKSVQDAPSSFPIKTTLILGSAQDPITSIQLFSGHQANVIEGSRVLYDLLFVQKSGRITSTSTDLCLQHWQTYLDEAGHSSTVDDCNTSRRIRFVAAYDPDEAIKGFLKEHFNSHGKLGLGVSTPESILCSVMEYSQSGHDRACTSTFGVFAIHAKNILAASSSALEVVAQWTLPRVYSSNAETEAMDRSGYAFDPKSGLLLRTTTGSLTTYDLCSSTPKLVSQVRMPSTEDSNLVHVFGDQFLVKTSSHCTLFEARYQAAYAWRELHLPQHRPSKGKRKRGSGCIEQTNFQLVQFFPRPKMVVALYGTHLIGYPILAGRDRREKNGQGYLINSFEQGMDRPMDLRSSGLSAGDEKQLMKTFNRMGDAAVKGDTRRFDRLFFETLEPQNAVTRVYTFRLVDYAVSKVLIRNRTHGLSQQSAQHRHTTIKLAFSPPRTIRWLISMGFWDSTTVQRALRTDLPSERGSIAVQDQDIVDAVAFGDPSSKLLLSLVRNAPHLSLSGLVHATKLLLRSFGTPSLFPKNKFLTQADAHPASMQEEESTIEENIATQELEMAAVLLEDGLQTRAMALKLCLHKIPICFSPSEVSDALKMALDHHDILLLIELIRHDLTGGGWTSRLLDYYPDPDAVQGSDQAINAMSTLLSCAADALGASGWLDAESSTVAKDTENTVSYLQDETSDVLEGVQECIFLRSFLKDFLRFEKLGGFSNPAKRRDAIGDAPTKSRIKVQGSTFGNSLPLGSKMAPGVSRTRTGAGGEIKMRSARDIAYKLSRRLGPYTNEKLEV